jgi:hypothetical protein
MSLRLSLGFGAALLAALFAVNCSPPLIRCDTDANCTSDMKCDVRQGVCVDKGMYIENPDGTPLDGTDGGADCRTSGCPSGGQCDTNTGQCVQ